MTHPQRDVTYETCRGLPALGVAWLRCASRRWGVEPDPQALAYCATFEDQRADLKPLSASG